MVCWRVRSRISGIQRPARPSAPRLLVTYRCAGIWVSLWRRFLLCRRLCHNRTMSTEARDIQKRVLPNGLVVITETMSHVRSVSVGVWVRNGSRREVPEENGLAHFMEHMVFKGTDPRSTASIPPEMHPAA